MSTTHIEKFIEDAIAGGYAEDSRLGQFEFDWYMKRHCRILLDPNAWRACGKKRGWSDIHDAVAENMEYEPWLQKQIDFVVQLAYGKSIDQALEALNN